MKNQYLIWGAIAVGAYLIYKKMGKTTDNGNGKELAPPPVSKPPVSRPPVSKPSSITPPYTDNTKSFVCPTKEQMARTRYTAEGLEQLRAMGCI